MKVLTAEATEELVAWCDRHGYDIQRIKRARFAHKVAVLLCERNWEKRVWEVDDDEYPVIIINQSGVWLKKGRDPYTI